MNIDTQNKTTSKHYFRVALCPVYKTDEENCLYFYFISNKSN